MNEDKMIDVLRNIKYERTEGVGFNMSHWLLVRDEQDMASDPLNVCKTTACLAGYALLNEGYTIDYTKERFRDQRGRAVDAETYGAKILGLTEDEAMDLFYLDGIEDVYEWVADRMGIEIGVLHDKVAG